MKGVMKLWVRHHENHHRFGSVKAQLPSSAVVHSILTLHTWIQLWFSSFCGFTSSLVMGFLSVTVLILYTATVRCS